LTLGGDVGGAVSAVGKSQGGAGSSGPRKSTPQDAVGADDTGLETLGRRAHPDLSSVASTASGDLVLNAARAAVGQHVHFHHGHPNVGNSCYGNSTLTALLHTPPFVRAFASFEVLAGLAAVPHELKVLRLKVDADPRAARRLGLCDTAVRGLRTVDVRRHELKALGRQRVTDRLRLACQPLVREKLDLPDVRRGHDQHV
jgi:hypothetical protein